MHFPHLRISSMIGYNDLPFSDNAYSTLGGIADIPCAQLRLAPILSAACSVF